MNQLPNRGQDLMPNPLPFRPDAAMPGPRPDLALLPDSTGGVLDALDTMSRRIDDLARELQCLGYFDDDDDDQPRAA